MTRIDSLHIDSLKSCMHADSGKIESLNDIIKANTAVVDSCTANINLAVDSLKSHIQICQNQIDSIYVHGDPFHHLSGVTHKLFDWLCDKLEMDGWNTIIYMLTIAFFFYVVIKMFIVIRKPEKYNKKKVEWNKKHKGKQYKNNTNQESPRFLKIVGFIVKSAGKLFIEFLKFFKELPERIIFFISDIKEYCKNQIKFDREILSENGKSLLRISINLAVIIPIIIILIVLPIGFVWHLIHGGEYSTALGIYDEAHAGETNVLWAVISQYLDPGNLGNSNGFGSGIAFVLATTGIVCLSGLLVSSIVNWISQRKERWLKGLITYENVKDFNDYVVIIGINEQTASIARRALESDDNRYVLIQTRQDVEKVRPELESKIDDDKQDRIVYYAGDRTSYEDIEKLHLEKAKEVYILGESVEYSGTKNSDEQVEKEHDAYNISCLEQISEYIKQKREKSLEEAKKEWDGAEKKWKNAENKGAKEKEIKKYEEECKKCRDKYDEIFNTPRLNVHVQFDYQSTFTAFKATHLYQKLGRNIRFIPFNIHELWAKKVLVDNLAIYSAGNKTELKVLRYRPIDTRTSQDKERQINGITANRDETVHLIIIGMNQMGTALATQAALLCHFPNFARDKSKKTVITFIDDNAIKEAEYYIGRYATLFELSYYRIGESEDGELKWKKEFNPFENGEYNHLITKDDKEEIKEKQNGEETTIEKPCLLDVEWEFIQGNAASKPVQDYIRKIVDNKQKIVTIAICFNDSQQSLASAMYLPKTVYDNCNQVLVYQRRIFDVANDVARGDSDWRRYKNLFPFGMSEASYTETPFDSHLAALDYYLYENEERRELVKQYFDSDKMKEEANDKEKEQEEKQKRKTFEDSFLKSVDDAWENAGIVRKTASIDSVDSIPFKLRSMGITYCRDIDKIEDIINKEENKIIDGLVEAEHNRWMMQRLISGFRHFAIDEHKYFEVLRTLIKEAKNNLKLKNCDYKEKLNILRDDFLREIHDEAEKKEERKKELDRIIEDIVAIKSDENKVNDLLESIGRVIELRIKENEDGERASYCICSFKRMDDLAKEMKSHDKSVIKMIPYLLRGNELLNALILRDKDGKYANSPQRKVLKEFFQYDKERVIKAFLFLKKNKVEDKNNNCKHGFWMADTTVNREQWYHVTGRKPEDYEEKEQLPVVLVSKKEVDDFIDILRKKSGLYFDLPSLKEWKTAASPEPNLKDEDRWAVNTQEHITKDNAKSGPGKVRSSSKEKRFLHHMFGNVWEWSRKKDDNHDLFTFAGGSWRYTEKECEINDKNYWWHAWDADSKSDDLGFRLVWKYDYNIQTLRNYENKRIKSKSKDDNSMDVDAVVNWLIGKNHGFKRIESGYFVMGADKGASDKPDANEGPRHTVHISKPFYMCQVPVTQSLWNAVMGIKKPRLNPTTNRIGDEIPQTDISWTEAKEFIDELNKTIQNNQNLINLIKTITRTDKTSEFEFRLPTEAEWEYAAKGGHKSEEPYCIYASLNETQADTVAWYKQPSIHEVAQKEPNKLGLYDMSGNVWEWCYDYYIAEMYELCIHGNKGEDKKDIKAKFIKKENSDEYIAVNPVAQDSGYSAHVFRGGSWRSSDWDCRCTRANYWGANYKANDLGFRLVLGCPIDKLGIKENETDATKTPEQS